MKNYSEGLTAYLPVYFTLINCQVAYGHKLLYYKPKFKWTEKKIPVNYQ